MLAAMEEDMGPVDDTTRQRAWSAYWSSGRLHSCASGPGDNYGGAIGGFWRSVFGGLALPAKVLDLATGNGPLPLLLSELHGPRVEVDAVDLAALAPSWHDPVRHPGVRFHSGVRMEALPFADASFDCVVSQFGFEYADRERAAAECARVARAGACIVFVMHHVESVLVRVGREELAHQARLLDEDGGLVAAAHAVAPWIAKAKAGEAVEAGEAVHARARYNTAMKSLEAVIAASPAPDLLLEAREAIHRTLMDGRDAQVMRSAIDAYAADLAQARLRTAEMVAHAQDRSQVEALGRLLQAAGGGPEFTCVELGQAEGVLAWALLAGPSMASVTG